MLYVERPLHKNVYFHVLVRNGCYDPAVCKRHQRCSDAQLFHVSLGFFLWSRSSGWVSNTWKFFQMSTRVLSPWSKSATVRLEDLCCCCCRWSGTASHHHESEDHSLEGSEGRRMVFVEKTEILLKWIWFIYIFLFCFIDKGIFII